MADTKSKSKEIDIRREIDRWLNSPLTDLQWDSLVSERYIDEIIRSNPSTHALRVTEIVDKIHALRSIWGTSDARNKQKGQETHMQSESEIKQICNSTEAISTLVTREAIENTSVLLFRTEVPGGKLLQFEEIEEWILQQAQKDGPSTCWLTNVPLSQTKANELWQQLSRLDPDTETFSLEIPVKQAAGYLRGEKRNLAYPKPANEWTFYISTAVGGTLERLRKLSEELAQIYKWEHQQATVFILTDKIPLINPINIMIRASSRPLSSRIILDIDPALTVTEVAQHYKRSKEKIIGEHHRNLGDKHAQLALVDPPQKKETWLMKMNEWNKTQKAEWRYQTYQNFAHECKQARARLLRTNADSLIIFGQQGLPH